MTSRFRDRREAGRLLGRLLLSHAGRPDVLVLALPRGGVPVAYEVATALGAPLDVLVVRKLGVPGHEEAAMSEREIERREELYRGELAPLDVADRTVILVDDGLAIGSTLRAAVRALRARHPAHVVLAVPIAEPSTCEAMHGEADDLVCAVTAEPFYAVGLWYEDFSQTSDDEVRELLERARVDDEPDDRRRRSPARPWQGTGR
jgi:putative phosphoribosyl transferase